MSQTFEESIDWVEEYNGVTEQIAAVMQDNLGGKLYYSDVDTFLYHMKETVVIVNGGETVVLSNDFMPVVPVITAL